MAILAPTFNFRDLPVHDLEGATRNFEQLRTFLLPEAWKKLSTLGYTNAWEDFEAGARRGEYRKNPFGIVELRGTLKKGESGKAAFTLPPGYRPLNREFFVVSASGGFGYVNVATTGIVTLENGIAPSEVKTEVSLTATFSVE